MSETPTNNKNGASWPTLIAAAALIVVLVGAFWSIVQTQFTALQKQLDRQISEHSVAYDKLDARVRDLEFLTRRNPGR